ncbi:MAG: DNA-3-methyladenine glycosylase 2 family protein [Phycisphaerales bacterium]|nr:DNA-3-methyladenine glycosylase 2 family protein [Phycisphaerales bacterium]
MWWPDLRVSARHQAAADAKLPEAISAVAHLCRAEARFVPLVRARGLERPRLTRDPFVALVGSVVQQQVSVAAAAAIYGRLRAACSNSRVTPNHLLALTPARMRRAGLSRQKTIYVRELARYFQRERLTAARLHRLSDDQIVERLTSIHGIGRWTVEMLLMFSLDRPDVWPVGDLGLRNGLKKLFEWTQPRTPRMLESFADAWRPYRSYATWYIWRSLEGGAMPSIRLAVDACELERAIQGSPAAPTLN